MGGAPDVIRGNVGWCHPRRGGAVETQTQDAAVTSWVGKECVRGARGAPFTRGWSGGGHRRRRRCRGGACRGAGSAGAERGRVARNKRRQAAGFARCGRSRGDRDRRRAAVVAVVVAGVLKVGQVGRGAGGAGAERGCGSRSKRRQVAGRARGGESRGGCDRRRAGVVVVVAAICVERQRAPLPCTAGDAA